MANESNKTVKVRLVRGLRGTQARHRLSVKALGLNKLNDVRELKEADEARDDERGRRRGDEEQPQAEQGLLQRRAGPPRGGPRRVVEGEPHDVRSAVPARVASRPLSRPKT